MEEFDFCTHCGNKSICKYWSKGLWEDIQKLKMDYDTVLNIDVTCNHFTDKEVKANA